jgi:hypothetical protein
MLFFNLRTYFNKTLKLFRESINMLKALKLAQVK